MSNHNVKSSFDKILTKGCVTAAYFSTSGYVKNKDWNTMESTLVANTTEIISRGDSGVFMESSDDDQDNDDQTPWQPSTDDVNKYQISSSGQQELTERTLMQSQGKFGTDTVIQKSEEKLSVISEKSCEYDSPRTSITVSTNRTVVTVVPEPLGNSKKKKQKKASTPAFTDRPNLEKSSRVSKSPSRSNHERSPSRKKTKKRIKLPSTPNKDINLDIPQVYQRQNTADLLHGRDKQIPVARSSVNRKISTVRNKMYGNSLRESTKKLQDDLRHAMRKYSSEKTQLLKQLSNLRHEMGDMKLSSSPSSTLSEISSQRSQSRYYMAPNLAAHKIGKKKKKTQTQETKITSIPEISNRSKEGILKLPTLNSQAPLRNFYPKTPPKNIQWDSGRNNYMHNLPPLDPPPGIAAAQDLLKDSIKIPKVQDSTRHDITRLSDRSNGKKKVHFADKHSVTEFSGHKDILQDFNVPKNLSRPADTKSLPPLPSDTYSVDSIKAYSALPPIPWRNNDLDPDQVIRATQEYKNLYLKMKDPEQRMRTLSEILYSVRLRMIENEHTLKYGINPKHMKSANTLCDFLMNRNHNSAMSMNSMNSDMASDIRGKQGIPHNTAARSGRKSSSLQLQSYLRKMSRSRRPSEDIRLSRMMGQQNAILEATEQSNTQTVSN